VRYFEIKTVDVEMIDIERSEGAMSHRHLAATPWEVEAERRREVLDAQLPRPRRSNQAIGFPDLGERVRGWFAAAPRSGKLDQNGA
jgi:hypothetical protein